MFNWEEILLRERWATVRNEGLAFLIGPRVSEMEKENCMQEKGTDWGAPAKFPSHLLVRETWRAFLLATLL